MIQISTPSKALNSSSLAGRNPVLEGLRPVNVEAAEPSSSFRRANSSAEARETARNKTRSGIFVKLLENLTARLKKESSETTNHQGPEYLALKTEKTNAENEAKLAKTGSEGIRFGEFSLRELSLLETRPPESGLSEYKSGVLQLSELPIAEHPEAEPISELPYGVFVALSRPESSFGEQKLTHTKNSLQDAYFVNKNVLASAKGEDLSLSGTTSLNKSEVGASEITRFSGGHRSGSFGSAFNLADQTSEAGLQHKDENGVVPQELTSAMRAETEGREEARLSELRGRRGRERLQVEVQDFRTGENREGGDRDTGKNTSVNSLRTANAEIEIPVDLRLNPGKGAGEGGKTALPLHMSFEDALASELRGQLSTNIVRDAVIIMRNGGEGVIRLALHPASLGDVKVRLQMTENKIMGRIIVESIEALRAFERELPVLEKAFKDSGFSEADLEMFLAQDDRNFPGQDQEEERGFQVMAPLQSAPSYEAEAEWVESSEKSSVNLLI